MAADTNIAAAPAGELKPFTLTELKAMHAESSPDFSAALFETWPAIAAALSQEQEPGLRKAAVALNDAVDTMWNDKGRIIDPRGDGKPLLKGCHEDAICKAQITLKAALSAPPSGSPVSDTAGEARKLVEATIRHGMEHGLPIDRIAGAVLHALGELADRLAAIPPTPAPGAGSDTAGEALRLLEREMRELCVLWNVPTPALISSWADRIAAASDDGCNVTDEDLERDVDALDRHVTGGLARIRAADAARLATPHTPAPGAGVTVPHQVAHSLLAGPSLGERVRRTRLNLNLSMREAARKSGISHVVFAGLEHERDTNLTIDTVLSVSKALGIQPAHLFVELANLRSPGAGVTGDGSGGLTAESALRTWQDQSDPTGASRDGWSVEQAFRAGFDAARRSGAGGELTAEETFRAAAAAWTAKMREAVRRWPDASNSEHQRERWAYAGEPPVPPETAQAARSQAGEPTARAEGEA